MSVAFDPPLWIKERPELAIRTLLEAERFLRTATSKRMANNREGVLRKLQAAHSADGQSDAGLAFIVWLEADDRLVPRTTGERFANRPGD